MAKHCPECHILAKGTDSFCPKCGNALEPGAPSGDESGKAEKPLWLLDTMLTFFPGFAYKSVIIAFIVLTVLALAAWGLTLHVFTIEIPEGGSELTGSLFCLGMLFYLLALIWLMCGEICLPLEAFVDLTGVQWMIMLVMVSLPTAALFIAGKLLTVS
ncbi:MAG: hypothetical protein ACLFWL_00905 [Candidatus Brocadiia bacterium]